MELLKSTYWSLSSCVNRPPAAQQRSKVIPRRLSYQLAFIVALTTSCSSATTEEIASSTTEERANTTTENLVELAVENFQSNLTRYNSPNTPSKEQVGNILRDNEVFGQLTEGKIDLVESKICEGFVISDLLATTPTGSRRNLDLYQDLYGLGEANYPDVFYRFTLSAITDIDTNQLENNATKIGDFIFLASEKRCTGKAGIIWEDGKFSRTTNYTTGYFPNDINESAGMKTFNYVQGGEGSGRFARTVSLVILEPARSAVAIVVTAFNIRSGSSPVTKDDMLVETSELGKEIKRLWKSKIESDPDWLTILD